MIRTVTAGISKNLMDMDTYYGNRCGNTSEHVLKTLVACGNTLEHWEHHDGYGHLWKYIVAQGYQTKSPAKPQ